MALNVLAHLWPAAKPVQHPDFPVWKTIMLGTCKTADEYRKAMEKAGMNVGSWADDIPDKPAFTASDMETEVYLVVASVAELGFKEGARYSEICASAKELGLELFPAEVGSAMRLAYKDQSRCEWLIIAVEAITGSGGALDVCDVELDLAGLWLRGHGHPDRFWRSDRRFIFVRPRS